MSLVRSIPICAVYRIHNDTVSALGRAYDQFMIRETTENVSANLGYKFATLTALLPFSLVVALLLLVAGWFHYHVLAPSRVKGELSTGIPVDYLLSWPRRSQSYRTYSGRADK